MSDVVLSFRGRLLREADVAFLRGLIAQHPDLSRRRLSVKVCEAWGWVQPNGQPRDMVCRSLLLALHRAGHLELPAKRQSLRTTRSVIGTWPRCHPTTRRP
ncbi:MAG: hypothetical protein M5U12_17075 [Verrucomicrobia bacterium]|nr:hypothetical protein [Verrucomicrobiota bacterium]